MNNKKVTTKDLLEKFNKYSDYIRSLKIEISEPVSLLDSAYKHLLNLFYSEKQIENLMRTIERIYPEGNKAKKTVKELLDSNKGILYELLAYYWLIKKHVDFSPQVETQIGDTLSVNAPVLDGEFNSWTVFFDIKSFEVPRNILTRIKDRLEKDFSGYIVMIEGQLDASYQSLSTHYLGKYDIMKNEIAKQLECNSERYVYRGDSSDISICIEKKQKVHVSTMCLDPYRWAEMNESFFLKNTSQYTVHHPFILICPYKESLPLEEDKIYIALRSIARRAFVKFRKKDMLTDDQMKLLKKKISSEYINDNISDYLSAIFFIDVSKEDGNGHFFANPNAKNPLKEMYVKSIFNFQSIYHYDDFVYDNY